MQTLGFTEDQKSLIFRVRTFTFDLMVAPLIVNIDLLSLLHRFSCSAMSLSKKIKPTQLLERAELVSQRANPDDAMR